MYKINGRARKTQKRESGVFSHGQWCVLRSPGCSAVVPLSLRDLFDSRWCLSLAVCEQASIKPGQCQRQKQDEHWGTKTRSIFRYGIIFLLIIECLLIELLAKKHEYSDA